ncbi:leucine-rich repeat domain-containing protein, partial [Flavobacterium ginsengisoli]
MGLRKTIFGRVKSKPNTFIGGIAGTINTPALLATKIGVSASQIKDFKVIGNDIQFKINIIYQIPSNAFSGNTNITYFNDSEGFVNSIGTRSFYNCTSLSDFIANNVESIAGTAFYNCTSITSYSFPKVTTIDSVQSGTLLGTFWGNTSLLTFSAPLLTSITGTGKCFEGASKMTTFYAPNLEGDIPGASFNLCTALNEFTVGPITSIGGGCFYDCSSLTSLTFNSLDTLTGVNAFRNCSGLKYFSANSLKDIPTGTFTGCISLENVYIASSESIPSSCFASFSKLKSIDISSVKTIASGAFSNCTSLLDFNADNVESIAGTAFYNCTSIT